MLLGQQIVLFFFHYKIVLKMTSIKYKHNLLQGSMCQGLPFHLKDSTLSQLWYKPLFFYAQLRKARREIQLFGFFDAVA